MKMHAIQPKQGSMSSGCIAGYSSFTGLLTTSHESAAANCRDHENLAIFLGK